MSGVEDICQGIEILQLTMTSTNADMNMFDDDVTSRHFFFVRQFQVLLRGRVI